jgi:hypothetical protein
MTATRTDRPSCHIVASVVVAVRLNIIEGTLYYERVPDTRVLLKFRP